MLEMKALAEATASIVREHVATATAPLIERIAALEARPVANDEMTDVVVLRLVQEEIAKIPPPENGKDADPEQVASLVAEEVGRAVAALPAPRDGKSVGVEDVAPLIEAEVGKAVAALPVPRSVKSVIINREGEAIYAYSDGSTENVGKVAGRDGTDADMAALQKWIDEQVAERVAAIPVPKDGRDGFNLEDFDIAKGEDGRTFVLKFERGDIRHEYELTFPAPVYCGIFKQGTEYQPGDLVTWGGCLWHCDKATTGKPDSEDWTLAVKRGRDGKDGKSYGEEKAK